MVMVVMLSLHFIIIVCVKGGCVTAYTTDIDYLIIYFGLMFN